MGPRAHGPMGHRPTGPRAIEPTGPRAHGLMGPQAKSPRTHGPTGFLAHGPISQWAADQGPTASRAQAHGPQAHGPRGQAPMAPMSHGNTSQQGHDGPTGHRATSLCDCGSSGHGPGPRFRGPANQQPVRQWALSHHPRAHGQVGPRARRAPPALNPGAQHNGPTDLPAHQTSGPCQTYYPHDDR